MLIYYVFQMKLKMNQLKTENEITEKTTNIVVNTNQHSSVPKYIQIADSIEKDILEGKIKKETRMPSINELSFSHDISRITVEKGYSRLRELGILEAFAGKGYFVKHTDVFQEIRIFLMFNKLSSHKKIIYDAFVHTLGEKATIDFYIYNNNAKYIVAFSPKV